MKKIKLTKGRVVLIDNEDFELISQYKWYVSIENKNYYYAVSTNKNKQIRMHRLIMKLKSGDKQQVDHINHNTLDNRKCNLRICTSQQNCFNRKSHKKSKSKYKGVYKRDYSCWEASIYINNKLLSLGYFKSEKEAATRYDRVALKEHGEFAYTNFPRSKYKKSEYITAQQATNLRDRQQLNKKSSKFLGVFWTKREEKWCAQLNIDKNHTKFLGYFNNEIDAAKAYDKYVIKNNLDKRINL